MEMSQTSSTDQLLALGTVAGDVVLCKPSQALRDPRPDEAHRMTEVPCRLP